MAAPKTASFDAALAFAQDLIRIPSMPGEEGELARRVVAEMEDLGYDEAWTDELGSVVGVVRGGAGPTVMLSAHLDMVAAGDPDEWEHPPFDGVIADGFLHGRGAMDIKGPLAIQTHVAAALRGRVQGDIVVAHPVYEERGGWGMDPPHPRRRRSAPRRRDHRRVDAGRHRHRAPGPRRGRDRGPGPGPATRRRPSEPATPSTSCLPSSPACATSQPASSPTTSWARHRWSPPASRPSPPASTSFPTGSPSPSTGASCPSTPKTPLLGRLADAVRPHLARFDADEGGKRGQSVEFRLATQIQRSWTGVERERRILSPGFLMDPGHPIVAAAARAVGARSGNGAPARVRPWTFATDGGWTCGVRGVPTIGFAPGEERHAHTNTERLDLAEARWGYGKYLDLVPAVQAAARRA